MLFIPKVMDLIVKEDEMKKIIILIAFMMISLSGFTKERGISFYAELGKDFCNSVTYTDMQIAYVFKFYNIELMPYGGTKTWFISQSNILKGGKPYCDIYSFGAILKLDNISIEYQHFCAHPIFKTGVNTNSRQRYLIDDGQFGCNSDKLAFRYQYN